MDHRARLLLAAISSLTVPALASAQTPVAAADLREVQAYRLSMPKLKQLDQVYTDLAKQMQANPRVQRIRKELAALQEKEERTDAEETRVEELEAELEEAGAGFSFEGTRTIGEMVDRIGSQPQFSSAVKKAGLAPRELATMQLSLFQTLFAYGFLKAGTIKELPKEVSADNVKFVEQHEAEIQTLIGGWAKEGSPSPP